MKIKFEVKNPNSHHPLFVIFLENKSSDSVQLFFNRFNLQQLKFGDKVSMEESTIPITDGIVNMDKINLKKFISALQLLVKS